MREYCLGGLMRCCIETLATAGDVYEEADSMGCMHCDAWMECIDEIWRWVNQATDQ